MHNIGLALSAGLAMLVSASLLNKTAPGQQLITASAQDPVRLMAAVTIKGHSNGHFITTAHINNRPIKVLVDTGASAVALSYEDARKAGINPFRLNFNIPVSTANGIAKAAEVTLRHVEIENVRVNDVRGMVLQKGAMRGTLLGMSFLGRLRSFKVENGELHLRD